MTKGSTASADPRLSPWRTAFPLVDRLPDATGARLAALTSEADFRTGEVVFPEGIETPFLALVMTGRLALRLHVPERGPRTILTLDEGDLLGWSVLVPPCRSTSVSVAVEPSRLALLDGPGLRAALAEDADLAAFMYPLVLDTLAERLAASRQQLLDLFRGREVDPW